MKKLAARDFEDSLQCAIPVFEGLLPSEHNTMLLDLLFVLCEWHALVKLRMHTDHTIEHLRGSSTTAKIPDLNTGTKYFNLMTYKLHVLGDYVNTIIQLGTSNLYSTQMGELAH
ncbi:hypothetical protein BDN71DRAFT_1483521 [Pleurotus eryngii]|uniref:Uncharacterized protein n=1 Tax=Pleurotus eryngii TaxID=5323 RepID=A0A9P5ZVG1_PLEER|nr:hypothetical protein BDN71DRAFT_1483521 [Pleurotus eryngii]